MYSVYKNIITTKVFELVRFEYPELFDDTCGIYIFDKIVYITNKYNQALAIEEVSRNITLNLLNISFSINNLNINVDGTILKYKNKSGNECTASVYGNIGYVNVLVDSIRIKNYLMHYSIYINKLGLHQYDGKFISILLLIIDPLAYINIMRKEIDKSCAATFFNNLYLQIIDIQQKQIEKYLVLKELVFEDIITIIIEFWVHIEADRIHAIIIKKFQ